MKYHCFTLRGTRLDIAVGSRIRFGSAKRHAQHQFVVIRHIQFLANHIRAVGQRDLWHTTETTRSQRQHKILRQHAHI